MIMRACFCGHVSCRLPSRVDKKELRLVPHLLLQEQLRHWANFHPLGLWAGWALLIAPVSGASLCSKLPTHHSKFDNYDR
jgi:hypothetical protein